MCNKIEQCFNISCYFATLFFFGYGVFTYYKDEDFTEISYKKYGEDSLYSYPSASLCVRLSPNLIQENVLKQFGEGINASSYESYLIGTHWDERMINISYREATKNLSNYVLNASAIYTLDMDKIQDSEKQINFKERTNPTEFGIFKCITLDIPETFGQNLQYAYIVLRSSIFPNGIRPMISQFGVDFHNRNKYYRAAFNGKNSFPRHNVSINILRMQFTITTTEMLHSRNKLRDNCKYYENYDSTFKDIIMQKIGCIPPYWKSSLDLNKCTEKNKLRMFSKEALKALTEHLDVAKYAIKPCVDLRKLTFDYEEQEIDIKLVHLIAPHLKLPKNESSILIGLRIGDPYFKEIKQVRAFGFENLIGNIGGYIGLFLGCSIVQLPTFCLFVYHKIVPLKNESSTIVRSVSIKIEPCKNLDTAQNNQDDTENLKEKMMLLDCLLYTSDAADE